MQRSGILVALRPPAVAAAAGILGSNLPLTFTHTVSDAVRQIRGHRFQLIVGTLQFDDSRLFELLPVARESGTPIIACKLSHSMLPADLVAMSFKAAQVLGFDACLDFQAMENQLGHAQALAQFRAEVQRLALPPA